MSGQDRANDPKRRPHLQPKGQSEKPSPIYPLKGQSGTIAVSGSGEAKVIGDVPSNYDLLKFKNKGN
jgi:hypothetical protein